MTHEPEPRSGDDYLFDGSGPPDADVQRLERALRPLGARDDAVPPAAKGAIPVAAARSWAAAAAVLVAVAAGGAFWFASQRAPVTVSRTVRTVTVVVASRTPLSPDPSIVASDTVGRSVETAADTRELTLAGDAGHVTLHANSRLDIVAVSDDAMRLRLHRGSLEARIAGHVRPRFFQVDTDAARCVDLGCRYTLDVTDDGVATVRVSTGQVAFETETREVYVPAGAMAVARKGRGPGTPRFEDARAALAEAFDAFDAAPSAERPSRALAALETVRTARDTLPAWHLLQEEDDAVRRAAESRIQQVAGVCSIACGPSQSEVRSAWKAHLEPLW